MKISLNLNAGSAQASSRFYVDELKLFKIDTRSTDGACCAISAIGNDEVTINLGPQFKQQSEFALFSLEVDNCDRELERLRKCRFESGGRVVPDKNGQLNVFEWPGGKNFMLEDPAGNRFLLEEDYTKDAEE